ncbi:MAG TPA: NAD(P)-binding domain-containing protein, partial [Bacillus sp. (in: firmicutes)]|nr:NAD(P)-binding domain-containing protein [Bacillus sp. (in: firmicutes)]
MYYDDQLRKVSKVVVIGLGQLGLPVAKYVKEKGFDTFGYDINQKTMEIAESKYGIKKTTTFKDFDVLIICVSTHRQDDIFSPQIEGLMSVVEKISREAKTGALISIESTVPKNTSKKVFEKVDHRLHVVHAPHRWYALEEQEHGVNQLRIIGGVSNCCLQYGLNFYDGSGNYNRNNNNVNTSSLLNDNNNSSNKPSYSTTSSVIGDNVFDNKKYDVITAASASLASAKLVSFSNIDATSSTSTSVSATATPSLGIPMHPVSSIEVAELTKIIENAHRYLQIAFAEELYLYCIANGISFTELRDSLNTKWNVEILEPRDGIGGHCLPKDTKMFVNSSNTIKSKILQAAVEIDEDYKEYIKNGKRYNLLNTNVLVIDDDVYNGNLVRESLQKSGFKVTVFNDPLLAIEYFKSNSKENALVILDIRMPGI